MILRGVQQVGKTTLVNQFAKKFGTYLYLNLKNKEALDLFESDASVEAILIAIYLLCGKQLTKGKRLKSLHIFMENTDHDIAVHIWSNPFSIDKVKTTTGKEFRLFNIPFHVARNIDKLIKTTE